MKRANIDGFVVRVFPSSDTNALFIIDKDDTTVLVFRMIVEYNSQPSFRAETLMELGRLEEFMSWIKMRLDMLIKMMKEKK